MTKEEAIKKLMDLRAYNERILIQIPRSEAMKNEIEALNMAIKALEKEEYYKDLAQSYEKTINKLTKAIAEQQPNDDCVSRAELKKWLDMNFSFGGALRKLEMFDRIDKELPPVTPTHKVGKWIEVWESQRNEYTGEYDEWEEHKCSVCGFQELDADRFKYCPNCGAEMRGSENG